jgi:hypothetical protein
MSKSVKVIFSIVVVAFLGCTSSFVLFARYHPTTNDSVTAAPDKVPRNLSGAYKGTVYLGNKSNQGYLMRGEATLHINEHSFQLINQKGNFLTGEIRTWIMPEKDNLGVGEFTLNNAKPIEIRWHRNHCRDTLKILRAQGAKREVRFCYNLTQAECFGIVSAPDEGCT